jgi:hypothetical protein
MLNHLPVDLSFVDEEDKVRYFTQGKERIFPRSPQVIGRECRTATRPHSVHVRQPHPRGVKKGEKDEAEFWIEMRAASCTSATSPCATPSGPTRLPRGDPGLTQIRKLEGQRRLLDWS